MGRLNKPQKSKKHRKIKSIDPFYNGKRKISENRFENSAPKNDDIQEIPRKVQFFMDNKDKFKCEHQRVKKRKHDDSQKMLPGQTRPMDPAPKFKQRKNEKQKDFLNRVENETQRVLLQAKLSDKYGISIDDVERGNLVKKKKMSDSRKEKLKNKKEKMKQKKKEREVENREASLFKDEVKFGEVVSAPPTLTAKPRKAEKNEQSAKPGRKSLLLKEIITANSIQSPTASLQSTREIGQSTKRKHMSMAKQQIMDAERQKAIDLYRMLKNKKVKES